MAAVYVDDQAQKERHAEWYDPDLTEAPAAIKALLESYSKVPPNEVVSHINNIREKAFASNPYPCIGHYRFLNLTLLTHPLYPEILTRLRNDPKAHYFDLGCCFGQDLRQLVSDGVPSSQLTGIDIDGPLMELGYSLFLDKPTLASEFVVTNLLTASGPAWQALEAGGADVVHCSAFFHLFPLPDQKVAARNIARLIRPGGVIVGRQSGSVKPGEVPAIKAGTTSFRHNVDTFRELWNEVGEATGTRWGLEGSLDDVGMVAKKSAVEDENSRRLLFTIRRIA